MYNLALGYEVAGRFDDARRLVVRIRRNEQIPDSAQPRISSLEEGLDARAQAATDVRIPVDRDALAEAARRQRERRLRGGDGVHP